MEITKNLKDKIFNAILENRQLFDGNDSAYSKTLGLNTAIFNRIKKGETEKLVSDGKLLQIGRLLGVDNDLNDIKTAETSVYKKIESEILKCKEHSISTIFCDEPEIGKTHCARNVCRSLQNGFYIDCSQNKTKQLLIRNIAKTIGIDSTGKYVDVKENLKYSINVIEKPVIILDDAGYLEMSAFIEIIELWNSTEDHCGWYMIGDDTLKGKIKRAIKNEVVGFRAFLSRFNNSFRNITPPTKDEKISFYSTLISDFLKVNLPESEHYRIQQFIIEIIGIDDYSRVKNKDRQEMEVIGALRRAKTFLKLIRKEISNEKSAYTN